MKLMFLAFALLFLLPAVSAQAASTPNSCRYSFDTKYRDMPVAIDTTASIVPDARYPAPTEVVPGQTLRTGVGTAGVELPDYLASFGYAVGLLHEGRNDIPVKVWVAISATNTKERVQYTTVPIEVVATTTITVDPADDNRYLSSTPFEYTSPVVPEMTWTAVGGDVVFSQDTGGHLPPLPIGTGDALRAVTGSAVIKASLPGASIYLDCRPGQTIIEFDGAGTEHTPGSAVPFASKAGPKNTTCLSSVGRQVSGAAANFPDGIDRELDPMQIALSASGAAPDYTVGVPYTPPATTLFATLSADTLATQASVPGLVVSGKSYPLDVWVTIAGAGTAEGAQTVRATSTYIAGTGPASLTIALPATSWTPTGASPIDFTLGLPNSSAQAGTYTPYGSAVFALGTEREPALLDCAPAAIRIAETAIPWSDAGRTGSAGRYAFEPNLGRPVFASAVNGQKPPPVQQPQPQPTPTTPPVGKPPVVVKAPAGRIASTRLTSKGGKLELRLGCPSGSSTCRGTIAVTTASKLKLSKRAKAKTLTLTRRASYTIAPGKLRTVMLSLSKDGRTAIKRYRTIKTKITIKTSAGVSATRRVTLSQRRGS
jgi:hypothetical protein